MKAIISKTTNTQAKLKIGRDQNSELLKTWRKSQIEYAKISFDKYPELQEVRAHISDSRLVKLYTV